MLRIKQILQLLDDGLSQNKICAEVKCSKRLVSSVKKRADESGKAMWLTPEATYVAVATEMNWRREFFGRYGNNILIDNAGHQYKCKGVQDYPSIPYFWVQGYSGDYFAIVLIFEPLPLNLDFITYIVPEGEPFKANFANWSGEVKPNLSIKELRANQKLFKYHPREMVK